MALPYARTFDEIYLYLDLRPCVCGETELDNRVSSAAVIDDTPANRIGGRCVGCGRSRQFAFEMPSDSTEVSLDMRYGRGDEPSRLLDPGEWLGVSEFYRMAAEDEMRSLDRDDDEAVARTSALLVASLAALDEVVKFIPDGAATVPEGSFWSQSGRMVYETSGERFSHDRLRALRGELGGRIADFERWYGHATVGENDGRSA